ncbi:MAG: tRNA (N6-threonylcarbamoyladenosine(37)-N6)-methyltransferase TrmO [Bacillota bacterium]
MTESIKLTPIGRVHNDYIDPAQPRVSVMQSTIEVFPEYAEGLLRLDEHSHIWLLGWFHLSQRDVLRVVPRMNKELGEYGVFGLRTFSRPNPIGLTVVKLESIQGNMLTVSNLDFINGTFILDIKPYYDQDIIFSPILPYIKPTDPNTLEAILMKKALNHHGEKCAQLMIAVKMAVLAEKEFGLLTAHDLKVSVTGSRCLGDALQGITLAKLANPSRFKFEENDEQAISVWEKGNRAIIITFKGNKDDQARNQLTELPSDQQFEIQYKEGV